VETNYNAGLPEPSGTIISILAANPKVAGEFYAINNRVYSALLIQAIHGRCLMVSRGLRI
jgi:hypothetical protein